MLSFPLFYLKNTILTLFGLLFLLFFSPVIVGQCSTVLFKGKVYDTLREQSFYNLMIINQSTGKGVFGQANGLFSVYVGQGDSITLSVKGYDLIHLRITADEHCRFEKNYILTGQPKILPEVIIHPIKSLQQIRKEREELVMVETRQVTGYEALRSPITALYQAFSKTERVKRKIAELQYLDSQREILKELLRTYVAYEVVNLTEEEFDQFIYFLNIDGDFLRTATEWELIEFIKGKYEHFSALKLPDQKTNR